MTSAQQFAIVGAACCGMATIVLGLSMLFIFPASAELSAGFRTPIIALEFASSDADLAFLSGDSATSRLNREKVNAGQRLDAVFPFAYAGLVAMLLLQIMTQGHRWLGLAIPFALLIIPFDLRENTILLGITHALHNSTPVEALLQELHVATWRKWGALGICIAALAVGYLAARARSLALLCAIVALSIATCWLSGAEPATAEAMSAALFLFFFFFSVRSVLQAWKLYSSKREPDVSIR